MAIQEPDQPLTAAGNCFILCRPAEDGDLTWKNVSRIAGELPRSPLLVDMATGDIWMRYRLPPGIETPMRKIGDGLYLVADVMAPHDLTAWLDAEYDPPLLPIGWRTNWRALDIV